MDHRCPVCNKVIVKRGLSQAVMIKLEIQCPYCNKVIAYNVHRAESAVVLFNFAVIVVLAVFAYRFQSRGLVVVAAVAAIVGAAALPLLEHTYLRTWPRYVAIVPGSAP